MLDRAGGENTPTLREKSVPESLPERGMVVGFLSPFSFLFLAVCLKQFFPSLYVATGSNTACGDVPH